jgi:hypothetical protein
MNIPVMACTRGGKSGYKYGQSGHCYVYNKGDEKGRKKAKQQAYIQGAAIAANTGEVVKEVDDFNATEFIEKYNQCHGAAGKFCSGSTGGGGGGEPQQQQQRPPGPKPKQQDAQGARLMLKPFVGKQVTYTGTIDAHGRDKVNGEPTACINKINVMLPNGKQVSVDHMWIKNPPPEIANSKVGQKVKVSGTIKPYSKAKGRDYTVKDLTKVELRKAAVDADELIAKYNHNHGPGGKFVSGSMGGGGGTSREEMENGEKPKEETQDEFMKPNADAVPYEGRTVKHVDNIQGLASEEMKAKMTKEIDDIATNAKLRDMKEVQFKELAPNVLMQCEGGWGQLPGGKMVGKEVIAVDPRNRDMATQRYYQDKQKVAEGYQPWLASGHAPTAEAAYKTVMVHEIGHAKMMEHVMKQPEANWINANNPMHGDKQWKDTVDGAIKAGWNGPSVYGKKNYGETFSESLALLTIKSSTGHKDVDNYVLGVLAE